MDTTNLINHTIDYAAPPSAHAIEVAGLARSFGKVNALRGMNMTVKSGSVTGFLGNNGAGKTTTIHSLLGFIPPHDGSIKVLGYDPQADPFKIRQFVGFFPERDQPYDWMTVKVLFDMGNAAYPSWCRTIQEKLCDQFSIETHKKIKQLSKGNVAKAKLAFALAHQPQLLILDEPTSGLDPASRYELLQMIRQLTAENRMTTLFSSHNLDDISEVATDLVMIHEGQSVFAESVSSIRNEFSFIGAKDWSGDPPDAIKSRVIKSSQLGDHAYWLVRTPPNAPLDEFTSDKSDTFSNHQVSIESLFLFLTRGWVELGAKAEAVE